MTYEQWDRIADAVIPALALAWLGLLGWQLAQRRWRWAASHVVLLVLVLATAYGWMGVDNRLGIWAAFGLDYSTHTAVSAALSLAIVVMLPRMRWLMVGVFTLYCVLMLYQRYHSVLDMASTLAVVAPFLWLALTAQRASNASLDHFVTQ